MIYEVRTNRSIKDLNKCDYCSYNSGYLLKDKNIIQCDKFKQLVKNDKVKCRFNKFQKCEVE